MDSEAPPTPTIILYGTSWCGTSRTARRVLDEQGTPYQYVDIDRDKEAEALVKRLNKGNRSVPTIVFADGSVLVEPTRTRLLEKLAEVAAA